MRPIEVIDVGDFGPALGYERGQYQRAAGPNVQASNGLTPFGFGFGPDGRLYVSEAPTSSASSYDVASDGTIGLISGSVPNGQGAACWPTPIGVGQGPDGKGTRGATNFTVR